MVSGDASKLMGASLTEQLRSVERRHEWVAVIEEVIAAEVAAKKGLQGATVRMAYRTLCQVHPAIVRRAIAGMWPEWVEVLLATCGDAEVGALEASVVAQDVQLANGFLAVVDRRVAQRDGSVVQRLYQSLRGQAGEHVCRALPAVARAIEKRRGEA